MGHLKDINIMLNEAKVMSELRMCLGKVLTDIVCLNKSSVKMHALSVVISATAYSRKTCPQRDCFILNPV